MVAGEAFVVGWFIPGAFVHLGDGPIFRGLHGRTLRSRPPKRHTKTHSAHAARATHSATLPFGRLPAHTHARLQQTSKNSGDGQGSALHEGQVDPTFRLDCPVPTPAQKGPPFPPRSNPINSDNLASRIMSVSSWRPKGPPWSTQISKTRSSLVSHRNPSP